MANKPYRTMLTDTSNLLTPPHCLCCTQRILKDENYHYTTVNNITRYWHWNHDTCSEQCKVKARVKG